MDTIVEECGSCPQPIKPMKDWIQEDVANCRPCLLPPVIQWYHITLEERSKKDLADELERTRKAGNPLEVCQLLDTIKGQVEEEDLRCRLREFDCAVQTYTPEGEDLT